MSEPRALYGTDQRQAIALSLRTLAAALVDVADAVAVMEPGEPKPTELLTVKEVAVWLRSSAAHVYDLIAKQDIDHVKDGRTLLFTPEQVERYIARHVQAVAS